jgi:hypothetical protein
VTPRPWSLRVPYPSRNQEKMAFPVCRVSPRTVSTYGSVFQTRMLATNRGGCLREVDPLTPARRLGPGRRSSFNQPTRCAFAVPHAPTTNSYFDSNRHLGSTCLWCAPKANLGTGFYADAVYSHTMAFVNCRTFTTMGVAVPTRAFSEKRNASI